jgi:hypothetical protein
MRRWVFGIVGLAGLLFGLGCLNYTNAWGLEHHQEVARQHNWPAPSYPLFVCGAASTAAGAGLLGFAVGRKGSA